MVVVGFESYKGKLEGTRDVLRRTMGSWFRMPCRKGDRGDQGGCGEVNICRIEFREGWHGRVVSDSSPCTLRLSGGPVLKNEQMGCLHR